MMSKTRQIFGIDASRALKSRRTGTERYALEIIRHLLATPGAEQIDWRLYLPELPSSATLFQLDAETPLARPPSMRVLPQSRLWTHRKLAAEVTAAPPDLLFVPAHVLPLRRPGVRLPPSVVTIHDIGYHYFPDAHTRTQRTYLDWSTRYAVDNATLLIAVSQATADDLVKVYRADPTRIRVVHEAAVPLPQPTPATIAKTLNHYAIQRPFALFVGTIQPRKNLVRLLEAYARLLMQGKADFDLVIAGADGWMSNATHDAAARLQLGARVHFTGSISEADHAALLHAARLFVFPSLFEGFGLPVIEAQQAGVPVMTANNSSLPEIAGDAALLVDPLDVDAIADAMLQLSQDEALRQRLIAAGHENVKRFSWSKAAAETLAVLREAADTPPRQR